MRGNPMEAELGYVETEEGVYLTVGEEQAPRPLDVGEAQFLVMIAGKVFELEAEKQIEEGEVLRTHECKAQLTREVEDMRMKLNKEGYVIDPPSTGRKVSIEYKVVRCGDGFKIYSSMKLEHEGGTIDLPGIEPPGAQVFFDNSIKATNVAIQWALELYKKMTKRGDEIVAATVVTPNGTQIDVTPKEPE
jgi:hypothetical protein